ncbi:ATP-binding protein [Alkalimarinus alittae]|uniref:histidine kinase n=1 Tax=Alkalimarinus alittae TaxID=2961619 RepID=A0ABY6MZP4_9ALTE|nr:ATP-binding protein [Alkalimarinus alittae]UZE95260.1 ATP-binding protein [Alkalimarinus alittae]
MNRLFLRVYGGLLLALMVVGLFSVFIYTSINLVRNEHHRVIIASPVFDWLAKQDIEVLDDLFSRPAVSAIGHISVDQSDNHAFSSVELERLNYKQVLVVRDAYGYKVARYLDVVNGDLNILVGHFPDLYLGVNQLTSYLIVEALNERSLDSLSAEALEESLSELAQKFGVRIELAQGEEGVLRTGLLGAANENGYYFYPGSQDASAVGYYKLKNGDIYRFDFPENYSAISWPLILTLLLIAMAGVGLAVYLLIVSIDRRLKSLETVATRIARGELDARMGAGHRDAIGRLGDSFNSMAEHIQRLVAVQREMIHAVSHELRTPVARIRFGVQMIEDCTSEAARHKQLTGIDSDIQELDELIDEILTYARLEQGGPILTFQDVDVREIVEQVVSEQSGVKPDMIIEAAFEEGSENWGQSDVEYRYIHRAIQNLVGNATRYASSTVKVHCSFDEDTCRVDVEDDGAGIPDSDWEKVFTPFARLDDSRTRSSGGYGLGLSIVRRILYWHGGQAFLGRSEMGGAKFSLVWPRRQLKD